MDRGGPAFPLLVTPGDEAAEEGERGAGKQGSTLNAKLPRAGREGEDPAFGQLLTFLLH
jgi:hypothetical protein